MTDPELVARAEHELRGAATALALACEALRRDPAASAHASVIDAQLDRLRAGLEDLDTARRAGRAPTRQAAEREADARVDHRECETDAGADRAVAEPVELCALTRAASGAWKDAAFEWDGPPITAQLDRRRFAKALGNLLANAAEHGSGDIRVTGQAHNGGVRLQVRNRGRGLVIASEAAAELGGSLSFEIVDDTAVATLDLPAA